MSFTHAAVGQAWGLAAFGRGSVAPHLASCSGVYILSISNAVTAVSPVDLEREPTVTHHKRFQLI